jgi:hypothetical protein
VRLKRTAPTDTTLSQLPQVFSAGQIRQFTHSCVFLHFSDFRIDSRPRLEKNL